MSERLSRLEGERDTWLAAADLVRGQGGVGESAVRVNKVAQELRKLFRFRAARIQKLIDQLAEERTVFPTGGQP